MQKDWIGGTQNVMATLNASNHSTSERGHLDYYATPPEALEKLLKVESFTNVWEPACGGGHLSNVLKKYNIHSLSSDVIDRGYKDTQIIDFLDTQMKWSGDILTNPPFAKSTEFVYKAMELLQNESKLALLLRIQFLESVKRHELFKKYQPYAVYVFSRNIRCAKNGDFDNATGNASTYAWFVWKNNVYNEPLIRWIL